MRRRDSHLQAVVHARHTRKAPPTRRQRQFPAYCRRLLDAGSLYLPFVHYRFGFLSWTVGGDCVTLMGSEAGKVPSSPLSSDFSALSRCASLDSSSASCRSFSSISLSFKNPSAVAMKTSWTLREIPAGT